MSQSLMKAWRLERFGGALTLEDVPVPKVRAGGVLIRIEASPLLTYLKAYVDGKLTFYNPPPGKFTPGTNGVGVIDAVGQDVWHLKPGQRVVFSPHFVAGENVEDPAQILIGLTAFGAGSATMQADWRDGALAEFAQQLAIDPWLVNPYHARCGEIDFQAREGEECLASNVSLLLEKIRLKYLEYGIKDKPYVAVKADAGTYGMGVMMVHDAAEVRDLKQGFEAVEERARYELGLIKQDEVFFQVVPAKPAAAKP